MQPVRQDRELQTRSFVISSMLADRSPQLPCRPRRRWRKGSKKLRADRSAPAPVSRQLGRNQPFYAAPGLVIPSRLINDCRQGSEAVGMPKSGHGAGRSTAAGAGRGAAALPGRAFWGEGWPRRPSAQHALRVPAATERARVDEQAKSGVGQNTARQAAHI